MSLARQIAIPMTILAMTVAPIGPVYASCQYTNEDQSDPSSLPDVLEIGLKGRIGSYIEKELINDIENSLIRFPSLKTIKIKLSSDGGSITTGFTLYNYLRGLHKQVGLQVITHNVMATQSAAVLVYCGGNQRVMSPYSYFMVHESRQRLDDSYTREEIEDTLQSSDLIKRAKSDLLSGCTNLTVEQASKLGSGGEHYFDSDKALELGLAHSIALATFDRTADIRCLIDAADEKKKKEKPKT